MAAGGSAPNFSQPSPWKQQILYQLKLNGEAPNLKIEGCLLAALGVKLLNDMESVVRHDLNVLKSLSAEASLGAANELDDFRTYYCTLCHFTGTLPHEDDG
ncbi:hypothetical protein PTKIN_Ptkin02bG0050200 [Pterospermum kingtungense]